MEFHQNCISQIGRLSAHWYLTLLRGVFPQRPETSHYFTTVDPLDCSSFRPLSWICADVNIFAKALVLRIEPPINKLVHYDLTGLMKGRMASDNLWRLLHIINLADATRTPLCCSQSTQKRRSIALDGNTCGYFWSATGLEKNSLRVSIALRLPQC